MRIIISQNLRAQNNRPVDDCSAPTGVTTETSRQPGCPEEKVKAIEDALRHFQMI